MISILIKSPKLLKTTTISGTFLLIKAIDIERTTCGTVDNLARFHEAASMVFPAIMAQLSSASSVEPPRCGKTVIWQMTEQLFYTEVCDIALDYTSFYGFKKGSIVHQLSTAKLIWLFSARPKAA